VILGRILAGSSAYFPYLGNMSGPTKLLSYLVNVWANSLIIQLFGTCLGQWLNSLVILHMFRPVAKLFSYLVHVWEMGWK
jgi:hypothetical protein